MTVEEFARRVHRRKFGDGVQTDPVTIIAIITALVQIGKLVYECYMDWRKDEVVEAYRSSGPLGWLRRRRVRRALAQQKLDPSLGDDVVAEAAALTQAEFTQLVRDGRVRGGY